MRQGIRMGIIGCGQYARYHMELMALRPEYSIVALCNPRPGQVEVTRAEFPGLVDCPVFVDHEDLLQVPEVDAVLVASPHVFHAQQVVDSLEAGKHVLVEKPLGISVGESLDAIRARDRSGKVAAIAYQRHGMGQFQFVRESTGSGAFGKLLALNSHLARPWLQLCAGTWRHSKSLSGGGQINDGGSHIIDALLWVTGLTPKGVSAMMDRRGTEVDIDSILSIEFEGGALGSVTIVGDSCVWHDRHHFWFEKGALMLENDQVTIVDDRGRMTRVSNWPASVTPVSNFADAVLHGEPVLAPFECGLRTMELTEAAWKSAESGGAPVEVQNHTRPDALPGGLHR